MTNRVGKLRFVEQNNLNFLPPKQPEIGRSGAFDKVTIYFFELKIN